MASDRVAAFIAWAGAGDPRAEWVITRAEARDLLDRAVMLPSKDACYFEPYCPCCGLSPDQVKALDAR